MIINHNIAALNTHRQLMGNNNAVQGSLEKLSSGLQINKAGDDAAGLAISEKMRGQIKGLEMASKNAQDGISLIQTAEGALNETHAILQRMRELAVQSSNDTNTDSDRAELQKEVDQLANAMTDISKDTQFNEMDLLTGKFADEGLTFHVGANQGQNLSVKINDMSAGALKVTEDYTVKDTATAAGEIAFKDAEAAGVADKGIQAGQTVTVDSDTFTYKDANGDDATATFQPEDTDAGTAAGYYSAEDQLLHKVNVAYGTGTEGEVTLTATEASEASEAGYYDSNNKLVVASETKNLVTGDKVQTGINISSQTSADVAITDIQTAIDNVSAERSKLGAVQNRLDHTINNLGASAENLTAAESRIRDVDMAKEMMNFTKNNILSQAAQAMLAQANQQPQGVLQLLR